MEGINHSSRERHSWSDRKGREGWNGIKTFCPPSDRKELCPDHVPLHPSGLFNRGTARPAIALCAHWQHSIIRPRQLQPSTPNDWRIRRARDRETRPPLRSTPPCSSVSPRGEYSRARSRAQERQGYWELIGGRASFESRQARRFGYISPWTAHFHPLFLLVLFIFSDKYLPRFDWSC